MSGLANSQERVSHTTISHVTVVQHEALGTAFVTDNTEQERFIEAVQSSFLPIQSLLPSSKKVTLPVIAYLIF